MVAARLLTTSAEADGETWVDVAHEALIRGWPRLRGWIDEDRAGLRAHRRLTEAAQEWQRLGQDEGALYRGSRLTEALELRERDPETINDLERRFLDAAVAFREAEVLQRERARRARERNQRRVAIGLAAGLLVAATLAVLAWTQRGEAQAGRRDALRAQQAAVAGESTAVQSQLEAVSAQETAESRRLEAEAAQAEADAQRTTAVAAQETAESRRVEAEGAQQTADARRGESESARATAEARRREAVAARTDADLQRSAAEGARATAEDRRLEAENAQLTAEARRKEADAAQQTSEANRINAELRATEAAEQRSTAVSQATVAAVANETAQADRQVAEERATEAAEQRGTAVAQATVADAANQTAQAERFTAEARATEAAEQRSTAVAQATVADTARRTAEASRNEANAQATIASEQRAEAERQAAEANRARLSQLAAQAVNEPAGDRALLLGAEAYRLSPETFESRSGLLSTLAKTPQLTAFLQSQNGDALDVVVSPDNSIIASADGYLIALWDGTSYLRLDTLDDEQSNYVRSLSFSPDGTLLAAGNEVGLITVWDVANREKVVSFGSVESDRVTGVAFNAAGTLIAAGNNDGTITVWDVAAGTVLEVLDGSAQGVITVAFSPDDRFLVAGLGDGRVAIWNAENRKLLRYLLVSGAGNDVVIAFNTTGNGLATATFPGIVTLWAVQEDVAAWAPIGQPLSTSLGSILDVTFSPNGKWLAAGGIDGRIIAWDVTTFAATELNPGYGAFVYGITFAGDGDRLFSTLGLTTPTDEGARRGAVVVWDLAATSRLAQPVDGQQALGNVTFSGAGHLLIPGVAGLVAWDPETQTLVPEGMMRIADFNRIVAVSSDGQLIAVGLGDGGIDLWNAGSWTQSGPSLPSQGEALIEIAFSRDGTLLAAISDHSVLLWDLRTRTALEPLTTTAATHTGLAFGPGNLLAVGSNQRVGLWDTSTRTRVTFIAEQANAVAFSPDGTYVAVGSVGELLLWDVLTDTIVERLSQSLQHVIRSGRLRSGRNLSGRWRTQRRSDDVGGRLPSPPRPACRWVRGAQLHLVDRLQPRRVAARRLGRRRRRRPLPGHARRLERPCLRHRRPQPHPDGMVRLPPRRPLRDGLPVPGGDDRRPTRRLPIGGRCASGGTVSRGRALRWT